MKSILCGNWVFGPCYVNDLAFGGVEFHVPFMTPAFKVVKIFLENLWLGRCWDGKINFLYFRVASVTKPSTSSSGSYIMKPMMLSKQIHLVSELCLRRIQIRSTLSQLCMVFGIIIYYPVLSGIKSNPPLNTHVSGFIFTFVYIILTGDQSPSVEQDYLQRDY